MEITNGTNPFDDRNFGIAVNRIRDMEKFVKKKIYILDAFPRFPSFTHTLNNYLREGKAFNNVSLSR